MKKKTINLMYKGSMKIVFVLFLLLGVFVQYSQAQICNGITTTGFQSTAGDVVTYTANIDAAGYSVTYSIEPNSSGAFFTTNGQTLQTVTSVAGANTISVNVGPNAGTFTLKLTFDNPDPNLRTGCSASRVVVNN
jgi:hypothetical protein